MGLMMDWADFFKLCLQAVIGAFVLFTVVCIGSAAVGAIKGKK